MKKLVDIGRLSDRQVPLFVMTAVFFVLSIAAGQANSAITFDGTSIDVEILTAEPQEVGLGDLDNDGDLDIVAAVRSGSDYEVIAWENNGTPFSTGSWLRCGVGTLLDNATSVAVADLDKDGEADIIVGARVAEDYEVIAFENDGSPFDGAWPQYDVGTSGTPEFTKLAVGDLDNDSWTDIVSVGGGGGGATGNIKVWENDGTPFDGLWLSNTASSSINLGAGLAVADLDNDGYLDIAANLNNAGDGRLFVFKNDGTPFVGAWTNNFMGYGCSGWPSEIHAADLDNDGYLDLEAPCGYQPSYTQKIWKNDGTPFSGTWPENYLGSVSGTSAATGDFNSDGRVDIAMVCNNGDVLAWENDGTPFSGSWTRYNIGTATRAGKSVAAGDLDGDGDIDVVTASGGEGGGTPKISAWENLAPAEISIVPVSGITNCTTPLTYTFHIDRAGAAPARGYDVMFQINPAVVTILSVATDVLEGSYLKSVGGAGSTAFYPVSYGGGVYGVSCAILGGDAGATGDGDLFTVTLTPVAQGTSAIDVTTVKLRDLDNDPLDVVGVDGSVRVDCTLPTMETIAEAQGVCYKTAPVFSNFGFDDDVNLDLAEYKFDSGIIWTTIFTGINAAFWDSDGWVLPGFAGLSEGGHTVYFRVKDDAGNWNGEGTPQPNLYSWTFIKDTVAPDPPTNFVALPGHDKVHLTWMNPTGDASFEGVEIRVRGWGDYPQYGTPGPGAPSYPSGPTDGTHVVLTSAQAYDDSPRAPRDIYYYTAFSRDCAGNYSTAASGTFDRSTSYWLGDIITASVGDGIINSQDLGAFSFTFAQVQGGPSWNAEADFGPTDDHRRFGIPLPDNAINFEDLMIFAMNYGKVSPLGTSGALLALTEAAPLGDQVSFRLVLISRDEETATYAVIIDNEAEVLKGFSLKLAYGVGNALESAIASRELTGKASEHFFGVIEQQSGVVEICVAALGVNAPFAYTGEVARVVVRETVATPIQLASVDLRDLNNDKDEVTLPGEGGETPFVPTVSSLMQNHPNPFNPVTQITYDVAVAGAVTIEIYDVSGHRVRTLVSGPADAGRHVIEWNGKDENGSTVHTGVYFYRMSAPGYVSPAKKMLLLK